MSFKYVEEQAEPEEGAIEEAQMRPEAVVAMPTPVYTVILLVCIAGVMFAQYSVGLEDSIYMAGFDKLAFARDGEYWRILTGAAEHGNLPHILMNGWALYSFGRILEMLTNRAHLANVFLLSAVGGGLLSLIFMPVGISVGASGGIVGLIGYLAVYAFRRHKFISPEFRRSILINIGFILVFGLLLYQVVDNWGHIGGLVAGVTYGLIQIPNDEYRDPRIARPATEITGVISLGIFIASSVFTVLVLLKVI